MATEHRRALLDLACQPLTLADLEAHTVCVDPGYRAYVEQLSAVLVARGARGIAQVDWEPIFHSTAAEPSEELSAHRYRVFAATIGSLHPACGDWISPGAIAVTLVEEAGRERALARRCQAALEELSWELDERGHCETAFVLLGAVLLSAATGQPPDALVERLREAEARHHGAGKRRGRAMFLWSCTRERGPFRRWRRCIEQHRSPSLAALSGELLEP